ncbi:STAS domain-containing protein [Streptomyces sp. NPDC006552]|uniref:STAS domain-containing protein n=1 Tax=Streptomyces sp. NPDC006552 TaxID=3157179 RepID=UPI0033BC7C28
MRQGNRQTYVADHLGGRDGAAEPAGSARFPPPPAVRTTGDCAVVELAGEIDLLAFQHMAPLIDTVAAGPYRVVVLDLTGTSFVDCAGLGLLTRPPPGHRAGRPGRRGLPAPASRRRRPDREGGCGEHGGRGPASPCVAAPDADA